MLIIRGERGAIGYNSTHARVRQRFTTFRVPVAIHLVAQRLNLTMEAMPYKRVRMA